MDLHLTASLRSAEGASLRSAGARFARLGLASLGWVSTYLGTVLVHVYDDDDPTDSYHGKVPFPARAQVCVFLRCL